MGEGKEKQVLLRLDTCFSVQKCTKSSADKCSTALDALVDPLHFMH